MNSMKPLVSILLLVLSLCCQKTQAQEAPILARGEIVAAISSETALVGDRVEVRLFEPLNLPAERIFVPVGAIISGRVEGVSEAERGLKSGSLQIVFRSLHYPNGYMLQTRGYLKDSGSRFNPLRNPQDGELKAKANFREKVFRLGKIGVGTLLGGPVGAAAATGSLLFDRGAKLRLEAGQKVEVQLEYISIDPNFAVRGRLLPPMNDRVNLEQPEPISY